MSFEETVFCLFLALAVLIVFLSVKILEKVCEGANKIINGISRHDAIEDERYFNILKKLEELK